MSNCIFWCKKIINDLVFLEEHNIIVRQKTVMPMNNYPSSPSWLLNVFYWIFQFILTASYWVKPKIKLAWPTWILKPYCLWALSVNHQMLGCISQKWWALESLSTNSANKLDSGDTLVDVRDDLPFWSLHLQS